MKVENLLPDVYYKESRDFAYLGRLAEIIFNYMKSATDCVSTNLDSESDDTNLIDLLVNTLGFEAKHSYITKDLIYIASSFTYLLRNKGTEESIKTAIQLLLNSQKINRPADFEFISKGSKDNPNDGTSLIIRIPEDLNDLILLEDLFDYILPAGTIYNFEKISSSNSDLSDVTVIDDEINKTDTIIYKTDLETAEIFYNKDEISNIYHLGNIYTGTTVSNYNININKFYNKYSEYLNVEYTLDDPTDEKASWIKISDEQVIDGLHDKITFKISESEQNQLDQSIKNILKNVIVKTDDSIEQNTVDTMIDSLKDISKDNPIISKTLTLREKDKHYKSASFKIMVAENNS